MVKTAIITGAAGFVGSNALRYFLDNTDMNFIVIDSFKHKGDSLRLQEIKYPDRVKIYTHDLTTQFSDAAIKSFGDIDAILNIASESHVDRSISDPVPFVENNVKLALTMAELGIKLKPRIFLNMGTDEVFGPALNGQFHHEWDIHKPSNPYAASKSAQDQILFSYWRCYGLPLVMTHTMNIFGPMQDKEKFIPMLISNIFHEKNVTIHGRDGDIGSRMYLHVDNLADAWLFLMQNTTPTKYMDNHHLDQRPDSYNITGLEEIDNLTLAKIVADLLGKELKFKLLDFHSARPGHDRRYALDGSKIKQLGWSHPFTLRKSLEDTINWTLNNEVWM